MQKRRAVLVHANAQDHPHDDPDDAPQHPQQKGFRQKQRRNLPPFQPESLQRRDLFRPPPHHHQHRIDDAHPADQQRAQPHHHDEASKNVPNLLVALKLFRHGAVVAAADKFAQFVFRLFDVRARRQRYADHVRQNRQLQLFRLRLIHIREAEDRCERVGQVGFVVRADDPGHGIRIGRVAHPHRIPHPNPLRIGKVAADHDHVLVAQQVAYRHACRFNRAYISRRRERLWVDQQHVDELWSPDRHRIHLRDLKVPAAEVKGSLPAVLLHPLLHLFKLPACEGFIPATPAGKTGHQQPSGVHPADRDVAVVTDSHVLRQRIANRQPQRAQRDHCCHPRRDTKNRKSRPARATSQVARRISKVKSDAS